LLFSHLKVGKGLVIVLIKKRKKGWKFYYITTIRK